MKNIIELPRGTRDTLPSESYKWSFIEERLKANARLYGAKEIRVPMFEHTELFARGVGDTTDVVQKEMYTFEDKKGRSLTLRPELTAGVVRSSIQNSLLEASLPLKVFYVGSCFRYEKAQTGRYRQFHQFGTEMFGSSSPLADAELIALASSIFKMFDIKNIQLEINSIGCKTCRKEYHKALIEYFSKYEGELCEDCKGRLSKNPMRLLDCKVDRCKELAKDAPRITDYLCEDCRKHFETLQEALREMKIDFVVNPTIVRGLDYYTKTVFEFVSTAIGAQGTVLGGGRYDGLVEELGGKPTPALGFAVGLERLLLVLEEQGFSFGEDNPCDVYLGCFGDKARISSAVLCKELREKGITAMSDLMERGIKPQMKYANKLGARFSAIIGDEELSSGQIRLKNMATGEETEIKLDESFASSVKELIK